MNKIESLFLKKILKLQKWKSNYAPFSKFPNFQWLWRKKIIPTGHIHFIDRHFYGIFIWYSFFSFSYLISHHTFSIMVLWIIHKNRYSRTNPTDVCLISTEAILKVFIKKMADQTIGIKHLYASARKLVGIGVKLPQEISLPVKQLYFWRKKKEKWRRESMKD